MATVVLSPPNVVNCLDVGGHFWVYMQYVQGLRRLGCDVYWLEAFRGSGQPERDSAALSTYAQRMERFGLAGKLILYSGPVGSREYLGVCPAEAEAVFKRADLLLNFHYGIDPA